MSIPAVLRVLAAFGLIWLALFAVAPGRAVIFDQGRALPGALRRDVWIGAGSGLLLILVVMALQLGSGVARLERGGPLQPGALILGLAFTGFLVLTEEMAVRGLLLRRLAAAGGPVVAVAVTALLFSALHFFGRGVDWGRGLEYLLDGIFLGVITLHTGDIWAAVGWHFAKNVGVAELLGHATYRVKEPLFRMLPAAGAAPGAGDRSLDLLAFAASVTLAAVLLLLWPRGSGS